MEYVEIIDFTITSPRVGWVYYTDTRVMLAVNVNTNDILWESDISGYLGEGNHLTLFLPEGLHRISATIRGERRNLNVFVAPQTGNFRSTPVHYSPLEIKAQQGMIYSYSHTHNGTVGSFALSPIQTATARGDLFAFGAQSPDLPHMDIRLPMPLSGAPVENSKAKRRSIGGGYDIGERREFFVVNTRNQLGPPHNLEAVLIHQSDVLSVWVPVSHLTSDSLLQQCIFTVETLIIPRVHAIWGRAADINGDGRLAILFSHTLNEEQVATGFFNPADFFMRNDNIQSNAYNPSSNEMDIIYVAIPNPDPRSSFSLENIVSTIAHEIAHASTFTTKTWNRIQNGDTSAAREELFLDEGWSHLTENLVGLGISGGNIRFLRRFLDNTSMYSFAGTNRAGQHDSVGMRGAITLFLSWLFWEAGGMTWDSNNPVELIDRGGIAFLQRMVGLRETGWNSIGQAFGRPTNILFNEMLTEINRYRITGNSFSYKTDPKTNEVVNFFVNMGIFYYAAGTASIHIGFPVASSVFEQSTLLPWSVAFYDAFYLPDTSLLTLNSARKSNDVFFSYSVRR